MLPISAYLGIMLAHGRLYVDSEMTVMRACGISEWYITRVMLFLSVLIMIVTGAITLYFAPMAAENEYQLREKARNEAGLSAIIPGRFQQTLVEFEKALEDYRFDIAAHIVYEFTWNQFCDWYLELTKPVLSNEASSEAEKRGTRHTLINVLENLLRLLHHNAGILFNLKRA